MSSFKPRDWGSHAPYIAPGYKSTILRGPTRPLVPIKPGLTEGTGPRFAPATVRKLDFDLTKNGVTNGEPIGERIVVHGRVTDTDGRPQPNLVVEVWQANAAGRYVHKVDQHDAPLDPNFRGSGRCITDANGKQITVEGDGVVGEQPMIESGQEYSYTSGTALETPVGVMQGHYVMNDHNGNEFTTNIEPFRLAMPNVLH